MHTLSGTIIEYLRDANGQVGGLVSDGGEEILISDDQFTFVSVVVTPNSRFRISGELQIASNGQQFLIAAHITNLDSKRSASLQGPVRLRKPGMPSVATPSTMASLANLKTEEGQSASTDPKGEASLHPNNRPPEKMTAQPPPPLHATHREQLGHLRPPRAMRCDAATEIGHAYDSLHRNQAILAYLNIMKRQVHGMSQMHEEAKHTYEQALSRHSARDFEGAREFATASGCLSRVVEGVISRTLRSDSGYPSLVSPPPEHKTACGDSSRVHDDLHAVESVLSRIHWLVDNGTLPLEDRTQVRRIVAWGEAFYQQARRMFHRGSSEDASELAQAAVDAAYSAEHICRNWYVSQAADSQDCTVLVDRSQHT